MRVSGVLLAAGRGRRLRPLTDLVPKPALPVLDVPLGLASLRALLRASDSVVVNVSHLGEQVVEALGCRTTAGVEVFDEGPEPYGTGGTLVALRPRLPGTILVANGDLLSDLDPEALLTRHAKRGALITLAVQEVPTGADLAIDDGWATGFIDRRVSSAPGARYLGMAAFDPSALDALPDRRPLGLAEAVFRPMIEAGNVAIHAHDGYALDVGTIDRYLRANDDVLHGRIGMLEPPPGEIVSLATGGRAYLGPGASASLEALGAGAVVLRRASVPVGASVRAGVVWPNERVPPDARVEHAVWAGGRAVTKEENARLDP